VTDVKRIVDQELGFAQRLHSHNREKDGEFSLNGKTAFLYVFQKRVAGFCTAEVIKKAYKLYIVNSAFEGKGTNECHRQFPHQHTSRSTKSYPAMLGIHQIWCHRSYRKGGIGTRLIDAARSRIVFGFNVPLNLIAFSSPTADGSMFAKKYLDTDAPLTYLCT